MPYRYLRDPLFLLCVGVYAAHKLAVAADCSPLFLRAYLNDFICIGFLVPIMVWVMRRAGLRDHDAPPAVHEIMIPLLTWSILFEIVLPSLPAWRGLATPDPGDVLAYCSGAALAALWWNGFYCRGGSVAAASDATGVEQP